MACDLTAGISLGCAEGVGGVKSILVAQLENVTSYTEASGEITGITMASTTQFWQYELEIGISNATATLTRSRENGTVISEQAINAILNENSKETRNQLLLAAKNNLFIIVEQQDGAYEAYGVKNGMILATATRETGTALADRNGNTLAFTGTESENPLKVDSTIITALLSPAA